MRPVGSILFTLSLIVWFAQPSSAQKSVEACPTFEPQLTAAAFVDIHINRSLSPAEERALRPCNGFQECALCPEMVVVQAGEFKMGSPTAEEESEDNERPQHTVIISKPFAVGRFAVTFDEWDACVAAGGCRHYRPGDHDWGRCAGLCAMARGQNRQGLSPTERVGVRICGPRGDDNNISMGRFDHYEASELRWQLLRRTKK
jgi:formylglycine-generating enzyme required for sulfatase activity